MTDILPVISSLLLVTLVICCSIIPCSAAGTETLITFNASAQIDPSVWGNWIAWEDQRYDDGSGYSDIFVYNPATGVELRLTPDASFARDPVIYNNEIVWDEVDVVNVTNNIMFDTLPPTGQPAILYQTDFANTISSPAFFGNKFVWQWLDSATGFSDILMLDISSGDLYNLTPDTAGSNQESPAIYGDNVVWQDFRNVPPDADGLSDIYMNDTSIWVTTPLATNRSSQQAPAIFGNNVSWMDQAACDFDIILYDINSHSFTNVTPYHSAGCNNNQEYPAIHGSHLIWLDNRNRANPNNFDIAMRDLTHLTETIPISSDRAVIDANYIPAVHDNRVVWTDNRNGGGDYDIYLFTDGISMSCPVASFTKDVSVGSPPLTVQFTDTSSPAASHWLWDFGDGDTSTLQNPSHVFNAAGLYTVTLTAGNQYCRNVTPLSCTNYVFSDSSPIVNFAATPTSGFPPLSVTFSDTSCGGPTSWAWDFDTSGDTIDSTVQNPVNSTTFTTPGQQYSVKLTASNGYGLPNSTTKNNFIRVFLGSTGMATLPVDGISINQTFGNQFLEYNLSTLPNATPVAPSHVPDLITMPPSGYGWKNITFSSADVSGLSLETNGNVSGNLTMISFHTRDITGPVSPTIGTGWGVNYQLNNPAYPATATITSEIWDGATATDENDFRLTARRNNFAYM